MPRKTRKWGLGIWLGVLLTASFACAAGEASEAARSSAPNVSAGQEIVLHGTIRYDVRPGVPERQSRRSYVFRVTMQEENTLIHTATEEGMKFREAAFEGDTVYRVLSAPVDGVERIAAEVSYFTVPPDDGSLINYLWLAYGSGRYFDSRGTNRLHPVWVLEDARLAHSGFTVEAWWERSPGERVPRKIIYLSDGYARTPQRTWKNGRPRLIRASPTRCTK